MNLITQLKQILKNEKIILPNDEISISLAIGDIKRKRSALTKRYIISRNSFPLFMVRFIPSNWLFSFDDIAKTYSIYKSLNSVKIPNLIGSFSFPEGVFYIEEYLQKPISLASLIERNEIDTSKALGIMRDIFTDIWSIAEKPTEKFINEEKQRYRKYLEAFVEKGILGEIVLDYVGKVIDQFSNELKKSWSSGDIMDRNILLSGKDWYLVDFEYSHETLFIFKDAFRNVQYSAWLKKYTLRDIFPPLRDFPDDIAKLLSLAWEEFLQYQIVEKNAHLPNRELLRQTFWNTFDSSFLQRLDKKVAALQELIEQKEIHLNQLQTEFQNQKNLIISQNDKITQLQQTVKSLEAVAKERADENDRQKKEITQLQQTVQSLEAVAKERADENDRQKKEIAQLQQTVESLEAVVKERADENDRQKREITQLQQTVKSLEAVSKERADENDRQKREITQLQQTVKSLEVVAKEKDEQINKIKTQFGRSQQIGKQLRQILKELNDKIANLESQLNEKEKAYFNKTVDYIYVKSTLSYSIGRILTLPLLLVFNVFLVVYRFIDKLIGSVMWPPKSRRYMIVNALVHLPQTIVTATYLLRVHGIRGFIDGIKQTWEKGENLAIYKHFYLKPGTIQRSKEVILPTAEEIEIEQSEILTTFDNKYRDAYEISLKTAQAKPGDEFVPFSKHELNIDSLPVKLIAFYLPQFHPIPENDEWWGKGFTEWRNVSKAVPQFEGHYQPRLPGELGFYDLRVPEVQRRQVELAKNYGIYGFCFHYYWFNGKRLLERPLDQFISDPEIDFPFCICWANENWTRRWDGQENDILIAQVHSEESDIEFIKDVEKLIRHKNYIKLNGRPLIIVYRVPLLPNPIATVKRWKEYCINVGIGEPYFVAAQTFGFTDPREVGFDAAVEFPPHNIGVKEIQGVKLLNPNFEGKIYSYEDMASKMKVYNADKNFTVFKTVCPAWDNEPRKSGRGHVYAFSTPELYKSWLESACEFALRKNKENERLVFINAWNEWGEGAYLEPDQRFGYTNLQVTYDVVRALQRKIDTLPRDWLILFISHDAYPGGAQRVLMNQIEWFRKHTTIGIKIICIEGGEALSRFRELADTTVLSELEEQAFIANDKDIIKQLLIFCGRKPDLIYGNSVASGRIYNIIEKLDVPIITHFHELQTSIKRYARDSIQNVIKYSRYHIACSAAVRDNIIRNYSVPYNKVSTVYSTISPDPNIKPINNNERILLRKNLGLVVDKQLVVGCGVGMPFRKGADLFIDIARHLIQSGRNNFHFYWIGEFYADENDPYYGSWAKKLSTITETEMQYITFLGRKNNPKEYMQAADIFLLPSREDPFPLVALEAAECSLPILCFDQAGGMPEFVGQDAGCVVPFADVKSMAQSVAKLLDDDNLRRKMGSNGRQKLLRNFTVGTTAPHIFSICRAIAKKKPGVSIIVPNYNHGKYLQKRLDSIFNQTYKDFEVILLDDASTDNSFKILEQYRDYADVRIVRNQYNSGSTFKQWLKGIELAQADIWWFAESDDYCEPNFLETLIHAFQNPKIKLAYCNSYIVDEDDVNKGDYTSTEYLTSLSSTKWTKDYKVTAEQEINDGLGVKNTILSASSALFRRFNLSSEMRNTLETMRFAGDWYFNIHAIEGGEVFYTSQKLNYHRRHSESVIGNLLKKNLVSDFFREFYIVQESIFNKYKLYNEFHIKWEQYLRNQWKAFFPDSSFEELNNYYPISRVRDLIMTSTLD